MSEAEDEIPSYIDPELPIAPWLVMRNQIQKLRDRISKLETDMKAKEIRVQIQSPVEAEQEYNSIERLFDLRNESFTQRTSIESMLMSQVIDQTLEKGPKIYNEDVSFKNHILIKLAKLLQLSNQIALIDEANQEGKRRIQELFPLSEEAVLKRKLISSEKHMPKQADQESPLSQSVDSHTSDGTPNNTSVEPSEPDSVESEDEKLFRSLSYMYSRLVHASFLPWINDRIIANGMKLCGALDANH